MKPVSQQNQGNPARRYDNLGVVVWSPLPKDILDNIFHPGLRDKILGQLSKNIGDTVDWDPATGICTLHNAGTFRILLSREEGIAKMHAFLLEYGNVWSNINGIQNNSFENISKRISVIADTLAANVALAEPYEFFVGRSGISLFKEKHLNDPSTHILTQEYSALAGSVRVRSVPLPNAPHKLPASHPELVKTSSIQQRSKDIGNPKRPVLAESKAALDNLFAPYDPTSRDRYGTDSRATADILPLESNLVNQDGVMSFIPQGDTRQTPAAQIGNDRFTNTASTIQDGTIRKSTLDGYARNANPAYPSSSFHPHPDWNSSVLAGPRILVDINYIGALIGIAGFLFKHDSSKYTYIYKNTTNIVDRQKTSDFLFKE